VRRAQPLLGRGLKVIGVGRDHHAVGGRQVESIAGGEIDARLGLVVARDLRAEDRIPGKIVAASEIDHQRDIAVRDRRELEALLEPRKPGRGIGPAVESVPCQVEIARHVLRQSREPEALADSIEIVPVQDVELAEGDAAGTHLLHGGLVLVTPGIGEGKPVELMA
jgi:hypothetical protein